MSITDKDYVSNIGDMPRDDENKGLNFNINWDNIINYKCSHLLPCGICEITNKKCPLHGWNEPQWNGVPQGDPCWTTGVHIKQRTTVGDVLEPWRVDGIITAPERECVYTNEEEKKND